MTPTDPETPLMACDYHHQRGYSYAVSDCLMCTPTDPETPQTAAGRAMYRLIGYAGDILAIEAEARAARDAEVRALVEKWIAFEGYEAAVLHLLGVLSDTLETGSDAR